MPTYNTVSVTGNNIFGNSSGEVVNVSFTPLSLYFDTVNNIEINAPVATATSNNAGLWTVSGLIDPTPAGTGMAWFLQVSDKQTGQVLYSANVQIAFANGASQLWLALTPPPPPATTTTYLVTPASVPGAAGQFLTSTAANSNVLAWNYGENPLNVRNFGADPTGVSDSTTAINNAIAAATGNQAPSSHSRQALNRVYLPTGTYKISSDLLIQSVQGFHMVGDGPQLTIIKASGNVGWTNGPITVDGSYRGVYEGFTITGDGTEQVNNGFTLTWTTGASRSTTGNLIKDISIQALNFVVGMNCAGVGTRQVDGTKISNVVVSGQQAGAGTWSNSGNWQQGFLFGSGSFGNIYDFVLDRCDANNVYYGYQTSASGFALHGAQPANNFCDFNISPGAQTTVTNVQSQNSSQLVTSPSNFATVPVTFNDIQFKTSYLSSANSNAAITVDGGYFNFNNISLTNTQQSAVYVQAGITVAGSSSSRPAVCLFNNLSVFGARTSVFTISNAVVIVEGYTNYNPNTGNSTYATGDAASQNVGGVWSNITGVTVPQVNFITATGNTSYTVPAGAQTVFAYICGGGGQGGGGGLVSAGAAGGGSGGAGGGYSWGQFPVSVLSSPVTVTVGAGGSTGGQGATAVGAGGSNGQAGGSSFFGSYLWCHGGTAGAAGATGSAAGGAQGGGVGMFAGGQGAAGSATSSTAGAGTNVGGSSGGGGGGGSTGAADGNGGASTAGYFGASTNSGAGGIPPSTVATAASAPTEGGPGAGGGGGYGIHGAATTGGNGATAVAQSGAGGGGGGGCSGGTAGGNGGNGGNGFALVIAYFQ